MRETRVVVPATAELDALVATVDSREGPSRPVVLANAIAPVNPVAPDDPTPGRSRPRAVVVEDSAAARRQIVEMLASAGYDVAEAASGVAGIKLAETLPDVMLVDLNLPDISGLGVCKAIRSRENTAKIPIVFLTADEQSKTAVAAFHAGADDYVCKPVSAELLILRINRIVREHRLERTTASQFAALTLTYQELADTRADLALQHRLNALGMLTSGLAHQMNSPLGALIASLQFVLEGRSEGPEDTAEALTDALTAANRVADLVRRMRALDGAADRSRIEVSIRKRCEDVAAEFPGTNITVAGEDAVAEVVDSEIREALLAVVDNAVRAVAGMNPGAVQILTTSDDEWVTVTIDDNGRGIDPADLPYLFTPFFTRHRGNQGKGLGLSLASAAARRHGGKLVVENNGAIGGVRATMRLRRRAPEPVHA